MPSMGSVNDTIEREGGIHTEFPPCPLPQPVAQHAEPTVSSKGVCPFSCIFRYGRTESVAAISIQRRHAGSREHRLPLGVNSVIAGFTG